MARVYGIAKDGGVDWVHYSGRNDKVLLRRFRGSEPKELTKAQAEAMLADEPRLTYGQLRAETVDAVPLPKNIEDEAGWALVFERLRELHPKGLPDPGKQPPTASKQKLAFEAHE